LRTIFISLFCKTLFFISYLYIPHVCISHASFIFYSFPIFNANFSCLRNSVGTEELSARARITTRSNLSSTIRQAPAVTTVAKAAADGSVCRAHNSRRCHRYSDAQFRKTTIQISRTRRSLTRYRFRRRAPDVSRRITTVINDVEITSRAPQGEKRSRRLQCLPKRDSDNSSSERQNQFLAENHNTINSHGH